MSASKITTMAQLRDALQQGGYVTKFGYSKSATYYPAGFKSWFNKPGENTAWPVDVSLVAYNALLNRGELRRLETSNGYRSSDWTLKSVGYTVAEAESKVATAQRSFDGASKAYNEAALAKELILSVEFMCPKFNAVFGHIQAITTVKQ